MADCLASMSLKALAICSPIEALELRPASCRLATSSLSLVTAFCIVSAVLWLSSLMPLI